MKKFLVIALLVMLAVSVAFAMPSESDMEGRRMYKRYLGKKQCRIDLDCKPRMYCKHRLWSDDTCEWR
ncbi:hypothetical protein AC249_AIPGENE29055 [Exaiptasia diaphana]|nr:hypothetical protein AC249_AIPGENE29055 [Exaiptasia diaphana]